MHFCDKYNIYQIFLFCEVTESCKNLIQPPKIITQFVARPIVFKFLTPVGDYIKAKTLLPICAPRLICENDVPPWW